MRITYDKQSDSKYIYLSPAKKRGVIKRTQKLANWLLLDYTKNDDLVGIEILDASKHPGVLITIANQVSYTLNPTTLLKQPSFTSAFIGEDLQTPVGGYAYA